MKYYTKFYSIPHGPNLLMDDLTWNDYIIGKSN